MTRDLQNVDAHRLSHVQFVQGDFEDLESMRRACAGIERAFLLTNSTERAEEQQTSFTRVAHESGVRHLVKLSQLHAHARAGPLPSLSRGGRSGRPGVGPHVHVLRPTLYMQGLLNFRQSIQQQNTFFAAAGDARISAVDVRDVADVAVAALTTAQHDNQVYAITGPDALTFAEMAHRLSQAVGRTITYVDVPPEGMRAALADLGFPAWQAAGFEPGVREALGPISPRL